jgi:hypothetical protein
MRLIALSPYPAQRESVLIWPNKVEIPETVYAKRKNFTIPFNVKINSLIKWCTDNLSSINVLWTYDVENLPGQDVWSFYFAQPNDAIVFRLVNGV